MNRDMRLLNIFFKAKRMEKSLAPIVADAKRAHEGLAADSGGTSRIFCDEKKTAKTARKGRS